jgi:hypothetical protein
MASTNAVPGSTQEVLMHALTELRTLCADVPDPVLQAEILTKIKTIEENVDGAIKDAKASTHVSLSVALARRFR